MSKQAAMRLAGRLEKLARKHRDYLQFEEMTRPVGDQERVAIKVRADVWQQAADMVRAATK